MPDLAPAVIDEHTIANNRYGYSAIKVDELEATEFTKGSIHPLPW